MFVVTCSRSASIDDVIAAGNVSQNASARQRNRGARALPSPAYRKYLTYGFEEHRAPFRVLADRRSIPHWT